jgi:hypothetical protein
MLVYFIVKASPSRWRALTMLAAGATLMAMLSASTPQARVAAAPKPKAARSVPAAGAGTLEASRCVVVNAYAELATGYSMLPTVDRCPTPKTKGGR